MEQITLDKKILLAYKGPFHLNILTVFGNYIRQINDAENNAITKLYKVFFELAQNVAYYSIERNTLSDMSNAGIGQILLTDETDHFRMTTSNLIFNEQSSKLIDYCQEVNTLDHEELRIFKSKKRAMLNPNKNGAHIGIIQIGILSLNKVEFKIEDLNDRHSVFSITAIVNKQYPQQLCDD
jgi:hypothetical protein